MIERGRIITNIYKEINRLMLIKDKENISNLFVCLSVKKAEPIRPKLFVGPHVTPGKVYG